MRIVLLALVVLYLAAIQIVSSVALRDRATDASLVHFAPSWLVRAVTAQEPGIPVPQELRLVLGTYALHRNAYGQATAFAQSLHAGADRSALDGAIAEARGEDSVALADDLAAGDLTHLEDRIGALARRREFARALQLQFETIAMLAKSGAQNDTIAEAQYRSGVVLQADAYATGTAKRAGRALERRSRDAYARAVALAPLEERYAIALANQDLNIGDLSSARAIFTHLRERDPSSVEGLTGLADAAIRAHDSHAASAYLDAAQRLAPQSPAIARLRARMHP